MPRLPSGVNTTVWMKELPLFSLLCHLSQRFHPLRSFARQIHLFSRHETSISLRWNMEGVLMNCLQGSSTCACGERDLGLSGRSGPLKYTKIYTCWTSRQCSEKCVIFRTTFFKKCIVAKHMGNTRSMPTRCLFCFSRSCHDPRLESKKSSHYCLSRTPACWGDLHEWEMKVSELVKSITFNSWYNNNN